MTKCDFCDEPCGNDWCSSMSKNKKGLTRQQKIISVMNACKTTEGRAATFLDTENIGLRISKDDKLGPKPKDVSDEMLISYLNRIETKQRQLDFYIEEVDDVDTSTS